MAAVIEGRIGLECGHWWSGAPATHDEGREFMDLCIATGDTKKCDECGGIQVPIVGPYEEVS